MIMTETTYLALTLDGTASWFGYGNGVAHVVLSTVVTQGGDHIGGNPQMQPACPGSKPMDAWRAKNGVTEKFQGDKRCKRCEAWLASDAGQAALEDARNASYAEENADMIAELKAQRSPERVAQVEATAAQWDAVAGEGFTVAMEEGPAGVMVAVAEPVTESEPAKIADPTADEPWQPRVPEMQFPRTGVLPNEAAIVRGKSHSGAPADRRTLKPGKGKAPVVASRGTMSDPTGRDHLDESVTAPDPLQTFVDTHPAVAERYGVTVRTYGAMSDTKRRAYRRKLCSKSKALYAAEAALKAQKAADRKAAKIAKGGK